MSEAEELFEAAAVEDEVRASTRRLAGRLAGASCSRGRPRWPGLPPGPAGAAQATVDLPTLEEIYAVPATGRADWRLRAACLGYPAAWWDSDDDDDDRRARLICADCPVLGDCRQAFYARNGRDEGGIWFATTEAQRTAARPRRARGRTKRAQC